MFLSRSGGWMLLRLTEPRSRRVCISRIAACLRRMVIARFRATLMKLSLRRNVVNGVREPRPTRGL